MIKAAIIACSLCAAASGTVLWVKAHAEKQGVDGTVAVSPSFWDLHANAHLENLPVLPQPSHSDIRTVGSAISTR